MTDAQVPPATSPLKAVGWTIAFLAAGIVLMLVFAAGFYFISGSPPDPNHPDAQALIIQTAAGLLAFGLVTWLLGGYLFRLSAEELRWAPLSRAGRGFGLGLMIGLVPAAAAILLSLPLGHAAFIPDTGGPLLYLRQVGLTVLILAPAALLEEVVFRGVGQVMLARAFGRVPAIFMLSIIFALAHIKNQNATPLGLINIALAGVFLGLAFYTPGGIWTAWGAHLGWNATLAAMDAPVSGLPFQIPWIDYQPGGPAWLTGGTFGPEGGVLASVAIATVSIAIWQRTRKETA